MDDGTPDETPLCRFRAVLAERGLAEALFGELNRQLDARGLVLKAGAPIDATLVGAAVIADKAYDSTARCEALAEAGVADGIMHRAHARRRLVAWQRWMNVALTPTRGQVERAFSTLKHSHGWRRVRHGDLVRNGAQLHLPCIALNPPRAARLAPRQGQCARNSPLGRRGRRQRRAHRRPATPL